MSENKKTSWEYEKERNSKQMRIVLKPNSLIS